MNLTKALNIDGWMTRTELAWLAWQARSHHRIVEVGSHLGRSTRALGDHTPGWVLAFDDWEYRSIAGLGPWDPGVRFEAFRQNLADLLAGGKVRVLRGSHADCSILPQEKPDMVFIDGLHEFEDVERDILTWAPRMAPGGLLCGHDFRSCPGVAAAVMDSGRAWEPVPHTDIWKLR